MKQIILSVVIISFGFLSCKKSDKTCDLSQSAFVGTYKVTSWKYKADNATPEVDEYTTWAACEKDDHIVFNANNTFNNQDIGTVCAVPGDYTGIWSLSGNSINVDGDVGTVTGFDCNGAVISIPGTVAGEVTTISLARQ